MHRRYVSLILIGIFVLLIVALAGCRRAGPLATAFPSNSPSPSVTQKGYLHTKTPAQPYPMPSQPSTLPQTEQPYPHPSQIVSPATPSPTPEASATQVKVNIPEASQTQGLKTPTPTVTVTSGAQYPGPQVTDTLPAYPGPQVTDTPVSYPGPGTSTQKPTRTPAKAGTPTSKAGGTVFPSPTPIFGTGTPAVTPTELPPQRPLSPPPAGSNVTIWYSWGLVETEALRSIIQSFQRLYPDVTFNLLYVPQDDLFTTYREASYLGQGPSLLLGPANWGPELYNGQLIADLYPYVPTNYLSSINRAALASAEYHGSLISLPLSQHGVVMFRNTTVISATVETFDELETMSHEATHAGVVGSYLERGSYFSTADLIGLGGRLIDDNEQPLFNDPSGLKWFDLLHAYDDAGAVTFNTNRDLDMFKRGRVGIIIDGTWNIDTLTKAIGTDKLAINPWPSFGSGHMSGWVEADSVFLNANTTGSDRFAALAFIGYLLDPNVQKRLAEVGHIPSVTATKPREPIIQQAMDAFSDGVPYPITADASILTLYWNELDMAIRDVFINKTSPAEALKFASDDITSILLNSNTAP